MKREVIKRRLGKDTNTAIKWNPKQAERINALLETGLWGSTPADTVKRIVDKHFLENPIRKLLPFRSNNQTTE